MESWQFKGLVVMVMAIGFLVYIAMAMGVNDRAKLAAQLNRIEAHICGESGGGER